MPDENNVQSDQRPFVQIVSKVTNPLLVYPGDPKGESKTSDAKEELKHPPVTWAQAVRDIAIFALGRGLFPFIVVTFCLTVAALVLLGAQGIFTFLSTHSFWFAIAGWIVVFVVIALWLWSQTVGQNKNTFDINARDELIEWWRECAQTAKLEKEAAEREVSRLRAEMAHRLLNDIETAPGRPLLSDSNDVAGEEKK